MHTFLEYQRIHPEHRDWPATMAGLTEVQANDKEMFERFSYYLVYHTELKYGTVKDYLRSIGQQLLDMFPNTAGSNLSYLNGKNNWLSKIVIATSAMFVEKAIAEGGSVGFQ